MGCACSVCVTILKTPGWPELLLLAGPCIALTDIAAICSSLVEAVGKRAAVGGMVAAAIDEGGARTASYCSSGVPKQVLDGDAVFPIMSISKVMTSLLLADMVYRHEQVGYVDWHNDFGRYRGDPGQEPRKITTSLQLSSGGCYEGCDLQVRAAQPIDVAPRERGALFASPANALHRVTPVTRGIRRPLVI